MIQINYLPYLAGPYPIGAHVSTHVEDNGFSARVTLATALVTKTDTTRSRMEPACVLALDELWDKAGPVGSRCVTCILGKFCYIPS